jgi:beta-lactamase superfamily II metal-dependent hydrolase
MNDLSQPSTGAPSLSLRVIQADYGDCLILDYRSDQRCYHFLIDGGPDGVYPNHLKPELQKVAQEGGRVDLMVLTHVDEDHVVGLVDLMSDIAPKPGSKKKPFINVDQLWFNTFQVDPDNQNAYNTFCASATTQALNGKISNSAYSISQGDELEKSSVILGVPLNPNFPKSIVSLDTAPRPVVWDGLNLWVIGPSAQNLERYKQDWLKWFKKHTGNPFSTGAAREAQQIDRSISNLSSIMLLAEIPNRSILLTGDGTGADILAGLAQSGRIKKGGKLHVNVLKVQHHGSQRNASPEFFEKITADSYVISAGKHKNDGNPDLETLVWIVKAAKKRDKLIDILVTNPNQSTKTLVKKYPPGEYGYHINFMQPDSQPAVV